MKRSFRIAAFWVLILSGIVAAPRPVAAATPDPVLEWIGIMNDTVLAGGSNSIVTARVAALESASVFDAVNGIEPRFHSLYVKPDGPRHASRRAAAIQAAYVILLYAYPAQSAGLTARRNASLAALPLAEQAQAIPAGVAWGQTVADAIWTLRLADGNAPPPPPFVGVLGIEGTPAAVGFLRPTPPSNASGSGTMGGLLGSARTPDQSELALFWAGNTPLYWNRIAAQIAAERGQRLTENAHLFGLLNVTIADASIACWDSKYRYVFWRPDHRDPGGAHSRRRRSDLGAMARLLQERYSCASRVSLGPCLLERLRGVRPLRRVWRQYRIYGHFGCTSRHTLVFEFLERSCRNRGCARLWRHSFSNFMRARRYPRQNGGRLRVDTRNACARRPLGGSGRLDS
jgi:hypothetical protein